MVQSIGSLLNFASGELSRLQNQAETLNNRTQNEGNKSFDTIIDLSTQARDLLNRNTALQLNRSETSLNFTQGSLSNEFNAIVSNENGTAAYSESLNVDFSFLEYTNTEENISITRTDEGLEIQRTLEQTRVVVAQLQIEQERTLVASNQNPLGGLKEASEDIQALITQFQETAQNALSALEDALDQFSAALAKQYQA